MDSFFFFQINFHIHFVLYVEHYANRGATHIREHTSVHIQIVKDVIFVHKFVLFGATMVTHPNVKLQHV